MTKLITYSKRFEKAIENKYETASWHADSSCTTDYETQAFDIFENGVELAVKAKELGLQIFCATNDDTTYFVLANNEDEAVARGESWPETEEHHDDESV